MAEHNHLLCMGCMAPIEDENKPCPACGWRRDSPADPSDLSPGTLLAGRYVVGRLYSRNAEFAAYIGYDREEDCRVWLREFFPAALVRRSHADQSMFVPKENRRLCADWLRDFTEAMNDLAAVSGPSGPALPIVDRFSEHNTAYVVERYFQMLTFGEFLARGGGSLRWPAAKRLFMPLFTGLSNLHAKGIVHGGISPDNLLVDPNGRLWLRDFCTQRLRRRTKEGDCQLYPGYSAPEQYSETDFIGSWTDVYAMAAVLYRTLTGTRPPEAAEREARDSQPSARELDGEIPQNVSDAIAGAMTLDSSRRIRTVDEFTAALLESANTNTAVFVPSKVPVIEEEEARSPTVRTIFKMGRISPGVGYFLVAMAVTFVLVGSSLTYLFTNVLDELPGREPPEELSQAESLPEPTPELYPVPSFVGVYEGTVRQSDAYVRLFTMNFSEVYNDEYPAGVVCRQQPAAGTQLGLREQVTLFVSKGSEMVNLPNLVGGSVAFAIETLGGMDLRYEIVYLDEEAEPDAVEGLVLRTDKPAGSRLRKFSDSVTLYVRDDRKAARQNSSSSSDSE